MTDKEIDGLAKRIGAFFHNFKDYTFEEFDNTEEDVSARIEQLKYDLTDIEAIDNLIFDITDCDRNLNDSYREEANSLIKNLKNQQRFLEKKAAIRMVSDTGYEVKHAIHIGDKEIIFAEDKSAENGMCWFVGNYTSNDILGQYADCEVSDDYLEAMQEFNGRVAVQIESVKSEMEQSKTPCEVFTAEHCYPNDRSQSIDGKIVAIKADTFRPEYRRGDVQLILVSGGNGAKGNSRGNAVFCYHLNDGKHTRFERYHVQGEVKPEHLPKWAKDKAAEILAEKELPQKKPKDREER